MPTVRLGSDYAVNNSRIREKALSEKPVNIYVSFL